MSASRARLSAAGRSFSRRLNQRHPPAKQAAAVSVSGWRAWLRSEITRSGGVGSTALTLPTAAPRAPSLSRTAGEGGEYSEPGEGSPQRRQFPRRQAFEVLQPAEQQLGCDVGAAGVEAGTELVEQLAFG